jgi:hypothetical protein
MSIAAVKSFVPESVVNVVLGGRRYARNMAIDQQLRRMHPGFDMWRIVSASCRVLPDREALLHHLPTNGVYAEVGVAQGDFSARILDVCKPRVLHLIDAWAYKSERGKWASTDDYETMRVRFADRISAGSIVLHRGMSWEMLDVLPDQSIDVIYLDAAHDFASVRRDLSAAVRKIKPTGFICGDDYVMWSRKAIRYGVVEAVNSFCMENGWKLVYLTNDAGKHPNYALSQS